MRKHFKAVFLLLIFPLVGCSTAPSQGTMDSNGSAPAWTRGPARSLEGDTLVFVGIGEDRDQKNARPKAEAIALQDLANECSLIPKGTQIQDHYDDTVGIIFRSYAKIAVSYDECQKTRSALETTPIRELAQADLTSQVKIYQQNYDSPEPVESKPLETPAAITDTTSLVVVRQQLALVKQEVVVSQTIFHSQPVLVATRAIANYEQAHPELRTGNQALSTERPNAINHQAVAVRDTIAERARIAKEYPPTPIPASLPKSSKKSGGRGSRHRRQPQPDQNNPGGS